MSIQSSGDGGGVSAAEPLFFVCAEDTIDPTLSGRAGAVYQSPPQSHDQALELVRLLVGRPVQTLADGISWGVPVAGGRRTVTIRAGRSESGAAEAQNAQTSSDRNDP